MERRPAELRRIAAVIFLLINFGVIISESYVIDDPRSTIICIAGNTSHNMTFEQDITAGIFTSIESAHTTRSCVRQACNRRAGHVAFLIEDGCFMVTCHSKTSCKTVRRSTPNAYEISITPYTWFDAAPVFSDLPKLLEVRENNQPGQIVRNIYGQAKSRWNQNASIKYTITHGNTGNAFKLDSHPDGSSVSLVATKKLDRETTAFYNLTIRATNTEENKTSYKKLSISVADVNDNSPKFAFSNYSATIFSNLSARSEVIRINATDADVGENARIRFYLLNHHAYFRMLPQSGTILLNQKVRVERSRTFNLIIGARNGPHRTITSVKVKVLAVNEYRPFFQNLQYKIKVSEAVKTGSSVTKVLAQDFDYGVNGKLNFTVIAGNMSYFEIHDDGEVRTRKSLLKLGGLNCTLTIIVADKGTPPKRAEDIAKVFITIEGIQRHKVKFDLPVYHVAIVENTPIDSVILTVRAVTGVNRRRLGELDQAERRLDKRSKRVVYSIANPEVKGKFSIGKHSGEIRTKTVMDYEKIKEYRLVLVAKDTEKRDESGHLESDTSQVSVRLLDLNDNAPRFVLDSYQKVINENTSVDTTILRVTANDADSGSNGEVRYTIENGNWNRTFELDNNGVLKLQQKLTRQVSRFFNLTVVASDYGTPPKQSKPTFVYIKINRPGISGPIPAVFLANVNESCPVDTHILRLSEKIGKYGTIHYFMTEIRDPEVENHFVVHSQTGVVRLIRPLDYEIRNRYAFFVGAVDIQTESRVDTALVRIIVEDENDNKPVFYKQRYTELLPVDPVPGTEVVMVRAFDKDSGKNAELDYFLVIGSGGFFRINSRTGVISTVRPLKEQNLRLFNITVSVSDSGTPPLTAVRQAQVSILVFTPFQATLILIETTDTTMVVRFNLKYLAAKNVAKYGVIVQEFVEGEKTYEETTKKDPLTWFQVNSMESPSYQRYIAKLVPSNPAIEKAKLLEFKVGVEANCASKKGDKDYCNGPLGSGKRYRFQLRAYLKSTGPIENVEFKDSGLSNPHFTALPAPEEAYKKEGRKSYDAVVYSVGTALVLVIILAFLRGFYRLKLDRKRIHEEKKKRISFPVSNPRFQEPNSPVERIKTPGPAKKMVAVNQDKGSEYGHRDEDEGSSPDSALDEGTRRPQERRQPTLQEVRLKNYFNSVEASTCASCEHVKIYCVQETVA